MSDSPTDEVLAALVSPPPSSRDEAIRQAIEFFRLVGSGENYDETHIAEQAAISYDRSSYAGGVGRQLLALVASGSRSDALRRIGIPTWSCTAPPTP